jgi:hypothetical protein
MAVEPIIPIIPIIQCEMAELYMYNTVLYRKISGLWRRYDTYSTVTTNHTRDLLRRSVSYQPNSYSDPALVSKYLNRFTENMLSHDRGTSAPTEVRDILRFRNLKLYFFS